MPIYTVRESSTDRLGKKVPAQEEGLTSGLLDFSLADAREQLNVLENQVRDRLYAEFVSQCADIAPYLRNRGRRWGTELVLHAIMHANACSAGHVPLQCQASRVCWMPCSVGNKLLSALLEAQDPPGEC